MQNKESNRSKFEDRPHLGQSPVLTILTSFLLIVILQLILLRPQSPTPAFANQAKPQGMDVIFAAGSIQGTITNDAGNPLEGIGVIASRWENNNWKDEAGAATGADGTYKLEELSVGYYRVAAVDPSSLYLETYYGDVAEPEQSTQLSIAGNVLTGIDIHMAKGAQISGTITLNDGELATGNSYVYLYIFNVETGQDRVSTGFRNEAYELNGLRAGEYRICAYPDYSSDLRQCHSAWLGDLSDAPTITLTEGETLSNVNFMIGDPALYGTLVGTVTDDGGNPLPDIVVVAQNNTGSDEEYINRTCVPYRYHAGFQETSRTGSRLYCAKTDQNGKYSIPLVVPDSYTIYFQDLDSNYASVYHGQSIVPAGAQGVLVAPGSVNNGLDGSLVVGAQISGKALLEDGTPPFLCLINAFSADSMLLTASSEIDPITGSYAFSGLAAGSYLLRVTAQSFAESENVCQSPEKTILVEETEIISDMNIMLAEDLFNGILQGQVTHAGEALEGINVGLLTLNPAYPEPIYLTQTDSEGRYVIEGLGPAESLLYYWDALGRYVGQFYLQTLALTAAEPISIGHTETKTIDIALDQGGTVRGRLLDPSDLVERFTIFIYQRNEQGDYAPVISYGADQFGNFAFGLPAGDYRLDFHNTTYTREGSDWNRLSEMTISLALGEVIDLGTITPGVGVPTQLDIATEPLPPAIYIPLAVP